MTLREQLEKVEKDLKKNEEKKKELLKNRKELLAEIELDEAKRAAEKNQEVMQVIRESFGEIDENNLELFRRIMLEQAENIQLQKERIGQEQESI